MTIENLNQVLHTGLVKLEICSTVDKAREEATNLAASTFGQVCAVTVFVQGGRLAAVAAVPAGIAIRIFGTDPVQSKASLEQVKHSYNRPIDKDHVKAVAQYIKDAVVHNDKYIIPALTVTAVQPQKIFTVEPQGNSFTQLGYMVLSLDDTSLIVTDGQHRLEGLRLALGSLEGEALAKLRADGVSIMFSFEDNITQVHQDFADCSKTKALPKSMIAVYDRRLPINALILDAIEKCKLFSDGKTDSTSTSLSKKSTSLLLTNSFRNLMKSLFTGNHSMPESTFEAYVNKNLSSRASYEKYQKLFISTIEAMTKYNPVLNQISMLDIGPQRQKIVEYREKFLIANPAGLSLACKAIYHYSMSNPDSDIDAFIQLLMQEIDWSKGADIWANNVVVHRDDKMSITSSNKPFALAIDAISDHLDVTLKPNSDNYSLLGEQ